MSKFDDVDMDIWKACVKTLRRMNRRINFEGRAMQEAKEEKKEDDERKHRERYKAFEMARNWLVSNLTSELDEALKHLRDIE